jgi:tetratricopeptide (TPR) repeat protein
MSMSPEKNDPCPCGSGKTFEKCCQEWYESAKPKLAEKKLAPTATECNRLVALLNAGQLKELESQALLLLGQYPDSGLIWNLLGASLQMQGKDGLPALQKATKFMPNNADAHSNLGNAFSDSGRLEEAEASYRRALQIDPHNANAHSNLGITLGELGRLNEAEACYRRALQIKPGIAEVYISLANVLSDMDRTAEAEASCRRALEIKPDYAEAHTKLGVILQERGLHRESVQHFQKAFAGRVGWRHDGDKDLSSGLFYAYIELTNKCNFHCDFCPSDSQQRTKSFMSMELIRKIYDELAEKKLVQQAQLHLMGEPTLHPDLVEVLAYASSKNIKTDLVTNGSTLNAKTIPKILDALCGVLFVSLQTPTRETFKHRGDTGLGWDRYIANIRLLVREYLQRIALKHTCRSTLELRVMVTKDPKLPVNIIESADDIRNVMLPGLRWETGGRQCERQHYRSYLEGETDNGFTGCHA